MKRRAFIAGLAGATAWPRAALAQAAIPVIGFLSTTSPEVFAVRLRAFRDELKEQGYAEGENLLVEYRWAGDREDRLPALAAELVDRSVKVIVAGGTPSSLAAKAATSTIPVVFETASDPVALGLVASLTRPGGNLTGVTNLIVEVGPKRLELLREVLPAARTIAVLVNPDAPPGLTEQFLRPLQAAAPGLGVRLQVSHASTDHELDAAFAALGELQAEALVIGSYLFFTSRAAQLGALSLRHKIPAVFTYRQFAAAGGLLSYGANEAETFRLVGLYTGKILKGEKPADLPIQRSTKVELIINLKTAKALGLTVPLSLLGRADEVIE